MEKNGSQMFRKDVDVPRLSVVAEFGLRSLAGLTCEQVLSECVTRLAAQPGVDCCQIFELLSDGVHLRLRSEAGSAPPSRKQIFSLVNPAQAHFTLRNGVDIRTREFLLEKKTFALSRKHKLLSAARVLIRKQTGLFGTLIVYSRKPRAFSKGEVAFFQAMANVVAARLDWQDAENKLRKTDSLFLDFFNNVPVGLHWLSPEGIILQANQAQLKMLGYEAPEFIGQRMAKFYCERSAGETLLKRLANKGAVKDFEAGVRCKDGSLKYLLIDADAVWEEGEFSYGRCFTRDITERRQHEKEILEISEREQQRIGQDLHDQFCQYLTGIKFRSNNLETRLSELALPDATEAREIGLLLEQAISQAGSLARGLYPVEFDAQSFMYALRDLASSMSHIFKRACLCRIPRPVAISDNRVAFHLYRIAQEALINALKHGRAHRVVVGLRTSHGNIILTIKDNGTGFVPGKSSGMGLHIMTYRAHIINGNLRIEPRPGSGTIVTCTVPDLPSVVNDKG